MKAVFIGCVQFSEAVLNALLDARCIDIIGVITREQSTFHADFASLIGIAREHGIEAMTDRSNDQDAMAQWLRRLDPDVIFCVGWPYLLGSAILQLPAHGVVGYHPADVPFNRGRHPIIWALALGLTQTASTFFYMSQEADAGPVIDKVPVRIAPDDDAAVLYQRLLAAAQEQIVRIARAIVAGSAPGTPQNLAIGNTWRKRTRHDGRIDWRMPATGIHNLVRALARPYPGAHCEFGGAEVKIWRVRPIQDAAANLEPGKVLQIADGRLIVKCGAGAVEILEHEFATLPRPGEYL